MTTTFKSLKNGSFALLLIGQLVSNMGDNLHQIALAWWVLQKTGSATAMGMVVAFAYAPMVIFLLVGGVVVDRFSRVRLMLFSDAARALIVAAVAWLDFHKALSLTHIYGLSLFFGFVDAFFRPAYAAVVPQIVAKEDLTSANALTELSKELTNIMGPLLGAGLISLVGTSLTFGLNAFSFVFSALCLVFVKVPNATPQTKTTLKNSWLFLKDGFLTVRNLSWLWVTIVIFSLVNIAVAGSYKVALPFFVDTNLRHSVNALGTLYASASVGAVMAALWWGHFHKLRRRGLLAYIATALMGVTLVICSRSNSVFVAGVIFLGFGFAKTSFGLIWTNSLQDTVPPEKLGRVISIDMLGSYALLPMGLALAGWGADKIGVAHFIFASGVFAVLLAILGLIHPKVRGFD